jgi:hypothetical protein
MNTPFPTFPHGGRSHPFPRGGKKKGGKNEQILKIMKIQKELYSRSREAKHKLLSLIFALWRLSEILFLLDTPPAF